MTFLHRIARTASSLVQGIVRGLTCGFDAIVGPVGRLSDGIETHLLDRTRLLRAHYAASTAQGVGRASPDRSDAQGRGP